MSTFTAGYFVGSLARGFDQSQARRRARAPCAAGAPNAGDPDRRAAALQLRLRRATTRPPARALKEAIAAVDAVLFVTPEYNRSIPGALKNAIDWASRPYGQNSFTRKPSAIIGTSPGKIGTAVAQQHLRSIMAFCNSPLMNPIEAYIQFEPGLITDDGEVTVESTRDSCAPT